MRTFAIVTTRLPPAVCGIGAYSALLRKWWPADAGPVEFLVMEGAELVAGDRITEFRGHPRSLAAALERIGTADLLLHYAGRGYQRFGCPVWMPGVFARWKTKFPDARLMLFVHELSGALPITTRHFWLGKIDSWIIRRLAGLADVLVTNTAHHAVKLRRLSGRDNVHVVPVSSNIEMAPGVAAPRAATEFVLFGLPFGRWQTLQKFDADVRRWHADSRLSRLHIIGPDDDESTKEAEKILSTWPRSIAVERHGLLAGPDVSRLLRRTQFSLTNVTSETWSKSGAFMASAAHECAVVIASQAAQTGSLSHAVRASELEIITPGEIERRTAMLAAWYRENADWPVIAQRMAGFWDDATHE